jgi:hypothetical protein
MEPTADEVKRLQGCINDLLSVLALPAIWSGQEPSLVVSTLLDALLAMLRLDFAYARLSEEVDGSPIEVVRLAQRRRPSAQPQEIGLALSCWLTGDPPASPFVVPTPIGGRGGLDCGVAAGASGYRRRHIRWLSAGGFPHGDRNAPPANRHKPGGD